MITSHSAHTSLCIASSSYCGSAFTPACMSIYAPSPDIVLVNVAIVYGYDSFVVSV